MSNSTSIQFKDRDDLNTQKNAKFQNSAVIAEKEFPNWGGFYAIVQNKNGKFLVNRSHKQGDFYKGVLILENEYERVKTALNEDDKQFLNYFMVHFLRLISFRN